MQYSIYDVLDRMENRPGMYVGEATLDKINVYLCGYAAAMDELGAEDISAINFYGFHEFVRSKFGFGESTAGWANIILAVTIGLSPKNIIWENYAINVTYEQHLASVKTFYALLREFQLQKSLNLRQY